jgi:predicted translin family RNA/ssDNA-binding protein
MLRNFTKVVDEVINEAYESGVDLFLENLEADLKKDTYIQENGLDKTLEDLFLVETKETNDEVKTID